jgi:hypothetical protein
MGLDILHGISTTYNKMKITIIGKGNAGCISALHFYNFGKFISKKIEIELIYDSKIKPVPTGQATLLDLPHFLWVSTDYKKLFNFNFTQKNGIMYENWGKKNIKWFHEFPFGTYGIHFDPESFQNYVLSNLKINFKEKDENIINYEKIDSDYIIDCRGSPNNLEEYDELVNPLNCCLLSNLPEDKSIYWTRTIATPDGWCFYIPLKNKVSIGYSFNKKITSEKNAINNFKKLFKIEKINKVFDFKQYVAKKAILNNRIFLNGNKLFFLEPLEATAMNTYHVWCRFIWDAIISKTHTLQNSEIRIKEYINKVQNFILWHYSFGSKYETKFWKYAKKLYVKNKEENFEKKVNEIKKIKMDFLKNHKAYPYAQWSGWNIKNWLEGME